MPLIDKATLVVGSGNYLVADVGTPMPADLSEPGEAWDPVGHTALEDVFSASSEGGESSVLGTLQNKNLRTSRTARSESFSIVLQQFDKTGLQLYYGSNMVDVNGDGTLMGVPSSPKPTTKAFLAVFIDGESIFGVYAPKAEIFRGDDLDISDTESLASLPLRVTPLQHEDNAWPYAVTPLGEVTP